MSRRPLRASMAKPPGSALGVLYCGPLMCSRVEPVMFCPYCGTSMGLEHAVAGAGGRGIMTALLGRMNGAILALIGIGLMVWARGVRTTRKSKNENG